MTASVQTIQQILPQGAPSVAASGRRTGGVGVGEGEQGEHLSFQEVADQLFGPAAEGATAERAPAEGPMDVSPWHGGRRPVWHEGLRSPAGATELAAGILIDAVQQEPHPQPPADADVITRAAPILADTAAPQQSPPAQEGPAVQSQPLPQAIGVETPAAGNLDATATAHATAPAAETAPSAASVSTPAAPVADPAASAGTTEAPQQDAGQATAAAAQESASPAEERKPHAEEPHAVPHAEEPHAVPVAQRRVARPDRQDAPAAPRNESPRHAQIAARVAAEWENRGGRGSISLPAGALQSAARQVQEQAMPSPMPPLRNVTPPAVQPSGDRPLHDLLAAVSPARSASARINSSATTERPGHELAGVLGTIDAAAPAAQRAAEGSAPMPPAAPMPEEPVLTGQLAGAMRLMDDGREVTLRLDPPELGRVHVTLASESDGLRAVLRVERAETADQIQRESHVLIARLAQEGIQVRRLEVVIEPPSTSHPSGQGSSTGSGPFGQEPGTGGDMDRRHAEHAGERSPTPGSGQDGPDEHVAQDRRQRVGDDSINLWI